MKEINTAPSLLLLFQKHQQGLRWAPDNVRVIAANLFPPGIGLSNAGLSNL